MVWKKIGVKKYPPVLEYNTSGEKAYFESSCKTNFVGRWFCN